MVLKIAHQVVRMACFYALRRSSGGPHPSPQNADGSLPHSISSRSRHPHAGSCLAGRHAMPSADRIRLRDVSAEEPARENSVASVDSV